MSSIEPKMLSFKLHLSIQQSPEGGTNISSVITTAAKTDTHKIPTSTKHRDSSSASYRRNQWGKRVLTLSREYCGSNHSNRHFFRPFYMSGPELNSLHILAHLYAKDDPEIKVPLWYGKLRHREISVISLVREKARIQGSIR